ncbi:MAG: response regulator, partial [Deltaproteobacteria bacterium]|nr:response regulator [Deltaproteobacteria bacterium]
MSALESTQLSNRPSILIVDDDEVFRTRLTRAFSDREFDTQMASHFDEAVALAKEDSPEFAVVDLRMP